MKTLVIPAVMLSVFLGFPVIAQADDEVAARDGTRIAVLLAITPGGEVRMVRATDDGRLHVVASLSVPFSQTVHGTLNSILIAVPFSQTVHGDVNARIIELTFSQTVHGRVETFVVSIPWSQTVHGEIKVGRIHPGDNPIGRTSNLRPWVGRRTNAITWSDQLNRPAWTADNIVVTADQARGSIGQKSLELLVADVTDDYHAAHQSFTGIANEPVAVSFVAKPSGENYVAAQLWDTNGGLATVLYDIARGEIMETCAANRDPGVGPSGSIWIDSCGITPDANGTYLCKAVFQTGLETDLTLYLYTSDGTLDYVDPLLCTPAYAGNATDGILVGEVSVQIGEWDTGPYIKTQAAAKTSGTEYVGEVAVGIGGGSSLTDTFATDGIDYTTKHGRPIMGRVSYTPGGAGDNQLVTIKLDSQGRAWAHLGAVDFSQTVHGNLNATLSIQFSQTVHGRVTLSSEVLQGGSPGFSDTQTGILMFGLSQQALPAGGKLLIPALFDGALSDNMTNLQGHPSAGFARSASYGLIYNGSFWNRWWGSVATGGRVHVKAIDFSQTTHGEATLVGDVTGAGDVRPLTITLTGEGEPAPFVLPTSLLVSVSQYAVSVGKTPVALFPVDLAGTTHVMIQNAGLKAISIGDVNVSVANGPEIAGQGGSATFDAVNGAWKVWAVSGTDGQDVRVARW